MAKKINLKSTVYPDWAAEVLAEWTGCGEENSIAIRNSLCTHPNMKKIWKKLVDRNQKWLSQFGEFSINDDLSIEDWNHINSESKNHELKISHNIIYNEDENTCASILYNSVTRFALQVEYALNPSGWDKLTAAEKLKKYEELLEKLTALSQETKAYDIGTYLFDLFDDEEAGKLKLPVVDSNGNSHLPSLSTLLSRAAEQLSIEKPHNRQHLLKEPNSSDRDRMYFVRHLGRYLENTYGKPYLEILRLTTQVFFEGEMTIQRIRDRIQDKKVRKS